MHASTTDDSFGAWHPGRAATTAGIGELLRGRDQLRCLKQLHAEQEDVRAALEWGVGCKLESAVELAAALFWFWTKQGLFEEGRSWLERAMTVPAPAPVRARLLIGLAHMHYVQGPAEEFVDRTGWSPVHVAKLCGIQPETTARPQNLCDASLKPWSRL